MAVSPDPSALPTVDGVLTQAYRLASLIPIEGLPSPEQLAHGRSAMVLVTDQLASYGATAWLLDLMLLDLVAGEETYSLPADVITPVDSGSFIDAAQADPDQTSGETPVTPITAAQWNGLSAKSASGRPHLYWADRSRHVVQVRVWPVPSDPPGRIRFLVQRQFGSSAAGDTTPDLNRFWTRWLALATAHDLAMASAMPGDKVISLRGERDTSLQFALNHAMPHESFSVWMSHDGGGQPWR